MKFDEINLEMAFGFSEVITAEQVKDFARLTGDNNRMHVDLSFGQGSKYGNNIVHGMLAGSLFSRLIGVYCPGEHGVYLSQTLNFKKPIFPGDEIFVSGVVIDKSESTKIITFKTEILKNNKVAIEGVARAIIIDNE